LYPLATPPLGILYIAAYLRSKFPLEIKVVNQRLEGCSFETLARMALDFRADIIGLSCMTPTAHGLTPIINAIRAEQPEAFIVVGGPHVSAFGPDVLLETKADVAIAGEGELSMEMLLEAFHTGSGFEHIPGLTYRNNTGEIITNPGQTPVIQDLDILPLPAYDLIDVRHYWYIQSMPPIPRRKYLSLLSSRGCPYACMWCHNIFGRHFRAHSPERIVEEVVYFKKKYGIDDIEFVDDSFNLDSRRVLEFSKLLLKINGPIKIAFPNALRADLLDEPTIDALVHAGTYFSSFALETGSPRIQELTGKRVNIPKFLDALAYAVSKRIFTNGFLMLGFPTETEAEMEETIRIATESQLHTASFFTVTPFPGTGLYDFAQRYFPEKLSKINYSDMNLCQVRVNMSEVSDDRLYYYQRKAERTFFRKPNRLYRILRDYPQPHRLPLYAPILVDRMLKGLF
jgi:anaerobic magnesium-protoporphyrin IX monomethyl ester cyclase